MPIDSFWSAELAAMRHRVKEAVQVFREGGAILVGDDGRRENEADLVFHARHATAKNVNDAITHARGLLCVSVSHALADALGFATAPRFPGDISHTGFTLAVDAKEGISSGISAQDRAYTIQLMAKSGAKAQDFLSPGHVFPVRAHSGGLLARTGHTEALQELCLLADLEPAAAMCEVLADDGEALRPASLLGEGAVADGQATAQIRYLNALPFLSTVDLLWYRVFSGAKADSHWKTVDNLKTHFSSIEPRNAFSPAQGQWKITRFQRGLEERITCEALVLQKENAIRTNSAIRILLSNGLDHCDNGVKAEEASTEIRVFHTGSVEQPLSGALADFCDLSAKEGLGGTRPGVKRVVTLLRAFLFLASGPSELPPLLSPAVREKARELIVQTHFPIEGDKEFLLAALV
jgi:3,4-dihydroxy 2-butanone 4-phosphate synthase / GTP cyclohydrolase II